MMARTSATASTDDESPNASTSRAGTAATNSPLTCFAKEMSHTVSSSRTLASVSFHKHTEYGAVWLNPKMSLREGVQIVDSDFVSYVFVNACSHDVTVLKILETLTYIDQIGH
jgi:hypothetical protein